MKNPFEKPSFPTSMHERQTRRADSSPEADIADLTDEALLLEEVSESFEKHGLKLSVILREMLQEGDEYRWDKETGRGNRSGSGFITATRFLAEQFGADAYERRYNIFDDLEPFYLDEDSSDLKPEFFERVRAAVSDVSDPGSELLGRMIWDLVRPEDEQGQYKELLLPFYEGEKKVGTCTTAETYFLEWMWPLYGEREGEMKVVIDKTGSAVLLEKLGMGQRSCLSLREVLLQGVRIPPGSLLYADRVVVPSERDVIRVEDCKGFSFLRFTTLALPPKQRQSFGKILQFQIENRFPNAENARIEDFQKRADEIVLRHGRTK